jgi:hypothetical protein
MENFLEVMREVGYLDKEIFPVGPEHKSGTQIK